MILCRRWLISFGVLWSCLLCTIGTAATSDSTAYQHFDISTGLPSNNIYYGLQDNYGYLWFATEGGILKYNGYSFKTLNAATAGIPDDDVYHISLDGNNRLWVHTMSSKFGYIRQDKFHRVNLPGQSDHSIYRFHYCFETRGFLYGLSVSENNKWRIVRISDNDSVQAFGIPSNFVCWSGDEENFFFVEYTGATFLRLFRMYMNRNDFFPDVVKRNPSPQPTVINAKEKILLLDKITGGKKLFFISDSKEVGVMDLKTGRFYKQKLNLAAVPGEHVYTGYFHTAPYSLVCNKNVYLLDRDLKLIQKEPIDSLISNNTQVSYFFSDNYNNKWFTSVSNGVWRLEAKQKLLSASTIGLPLSTRHVGVINGINYWWQSKGNMLYWLDEMGNTGKWYMPEINRLEAVTSWNHDSLCLSENHRTLILDVLSGSRKMLLADGRRQIVHDQVLYNNTFMGKDFYFNGQFYCIRHTADTLISAATGGIIIYHFYHDSVVAKYLRHDRYVSGWHDSILKKYAFYNTENIAVVNLPQETLNVFYTNQLFGTQKPVKIETDQRGNYFILTNSQLFFYNICTGQWRTLLQNSIFTNAQIAIADTMLIVGGRFGVAAAPILGRNGIGSFYFTRNVQNSCYRELKEIVSLAKGRILLQTDRGWFETSIEKLRHNGERYAEGGRINIFDLALNEPEERTMNDGDTINLSQPVNRLQVDAINFYGVGRVIYNYKIEGINDEWQQSVSGELYLDKIVPGRYYTLQVKMNDDVWRSGILKLQLYIRPYWYQTTGWHIVFWVAAGISIILAILGIIYVTRYVVIRAHARRQMLTDLELRAIHSQINPHFIFNTLSTALYFINRREYENAYGHVNKFSHLLRSYLKSSHNRYVMLADEIEMLKRYIELQQARFEDKFSYEITVENKVPAGFIEIPSLLLQPLVENAINHGLFHRKDGGGMLRINFEQGITSNELVCRIEDNGVGREQAAIIKQQNDAARESFGTRLTEKLVSIFRQYEEVNISIVYTDKLPPETGTIVTLTLGNIRFIT